MRPSREMVWKERVGKVGAFYWRRGVEEAIGDDGREVMLPAETDLDEAVIIVKDHNFVMFVVVGIGVER
jgi:hypothetical protein